MVKNLKLALILCLLALLSAGPSLAKDYIIKTVSDPIANKPFYFEPDNLTIAVGDSITFINAQDDNHDVMFVEVPKALNKFIASDLFAKEGDKFTYKFTIPGTYVFHCHPHEALGMAGTIIVGEASKAGETVKLDHHKLTAAQMDHSSMDHEGMSGAMQDASASKPQKPIAVVGVLKGIDPVKRQIIVAHDPIKALSWPSMTMTFNIGDHSDLTKLKEGDKVWFDLQPIDGNDYQVIKLRSRP